MRGGDEGGMGVHAVLRPWGGGKRRGRREGVDGMGWVTMDGWTVFKAPTVAL